jgi:hypothetical protein
MSTGVGFYDENGAPLWDTTDFNINTYGVYTINAGTRVTIPLPKELYNSNIYLRRRNVISPGAVYSSAQVFDAYVQRDPASLSIYVVVDASRAPAGVLEIYVK